MTTTERTYSSLREKIAAEKVERQVRYARFASAHAAADAAGRAAAESHTPTPMVVVQHLNPLDDSSPITRVYEPVADGVCGFAWVVFSKGNTSFAHWAREHAGYSKHYYGGISMWVDAYRQSMERKEAYARAYAETMNELLPDAGGRFYAGSRMD